jgi:hypothetical protein
MILACLDFFAQKFFIFTVLELEIWFQVVSASLHLSKHHFLAGLRTFSWSLQSQKSFSSCLAGI